MHFKGQKIRSKSTREVPLQPATLAWLEPFKTQKGIIWRNAKVYDYRMAQLREKAGVTGIRDGFRHSCASYRIKQVKGNMAQVAAEMGNSIAELTESYRRSVTEAEAEGWFSIMRGVITSPR